MHEKKRLISLQKKLEKNKINELIFLEKNKNKELKHYEKIFKKLFSAKTLKIVSRKKLLTACKQNDYIFFGDYHPLNQSQKSALRLLEQIAKYNKNIVICIEFILHEFQQEINHFLEQKITLGELNESVRYSENWPFPWENYSNFLIFARKHNFALLAINIKAKKASHALVERDIAAAKIIAEHKKNSAPTKNCYFIFYGELHLSPPFLPKSLQKELGKETQKFLTIYQNINSLYWKMQEKRAAHSSDVIQINHNTFCIINATPWIKLQAYADWLEGNLSSTEDESITTDPFSKIVEYAEFVKKIIRMTEPLYVDYTVYDHSSKIQFKKLATKKFKRQNAHTQMINHSLHLHRPLIIPKEKIIFNPTNSINSIGELAAQLTFYSKHRHAYLKGMPPSNYFRFLVYFLRSYIGSKIINPKRKCNEINDIEQFLEKNRGKRKILRSLKKLKYQAFEQAHASILFIYRKKQTKKSLPKKNAVIFEATRTAGFILGERIFDQFSLQKLSINDLKEIFLKNPRTEDAAIRFLHDLQKKFLREKILFKSKGEKF